MNFFLRSSKPPFDDYSFTSSLCSFFFRISSWIEGGSNSLCDFNFATEISFLRFSFLLIFLSRKYSPDIILRSSFLGCCSGGKGVYSFFLFSFRCFLVFLLFYWIFLNFGRNRDQFLPFIFGSFSNSLLIISSFML